jgi:O-antigen ligase
MATAALSGSLVACYALLQWAGIDFVPWTGDTGRVFSTFGNPDMLGNYLIFPFVLAVGLALSASDRRRSIGWWAAAVVNGAALYATYTRGAWIGALIALVCLAITGWQREWAGSRRVKLLFGAAATALIGLATVAIVLIRPRAAGKSTTLSATLERLSNGRSIIWLTGLRAWLARPLLGWGPDGFTRAFDSAVGADWYAIVDGAPGVDNAHNFLIQRLVTLGIPGLALTVWALAQTAFESFRGLIGTSGGNRVRLASLWAVLIGLTTALCFGVSVPIVSIWLWLTVGLLLAPLSRRVPTLPRAVFAISAGIGVALALWAGSWLVADVIVGRATQLTPGPQQVAELDMAARLNPLAQGYRWQVAEALLNETLAEQSAGQSPTAVDQMMLGVLSRYDALVQADPGDSLVRVAYVNLLVGFAARHPGSNAAQRAVDVALDASRLAPHSAVVLTALARAYQIAGRPADADRTARLARLIAPDYAVQTLGSLGLGGAATP